MAKLLNKDPVTYERERDGFIKGLHHFHETRGTPFRRPPKISGNEIDLYLLYVLVTAHGGWIKVNNRNEWTALCEQFHLPRECVNSGVGLKQIYLRYLDRYEKVHFLGEDGQQADDEDEDSRHRKWSARALHSVPLTYNHHQHNVAESLREYNGLSADLYKPSNYDKLALSLLSPLPNEQDFAINVCTLLSNEGKHSLRLDKYPRLVNLLLAHAGVFDSPGTRQLFVEVYSRVRNYSINSFWSDVLESQDALDLTDERSFMRKAASTPKTFSRRKILEREKQSKQHRVENEENVTPMETEEVSTSCLRLDCTPSEKDEVDASFKDQNQNSIRFDEEDKDLFCVGRTLGTHDPYGQRVLQIASILRNLSFTPENVVVLGRNRCFLRFVLLCVGARWSNLHQLGFDMLGNVATEILLKEAGQRITTVALFSVSRGINSTDRFIVIASLEVLNKVSQQDCNEEIVTLGLEDETYEAICRFLALSDIALLVHTLECLYALTSLGERPCTSVARVRGAIDTLVALVTVEAQSYGPKACILMRVVETVSTIVPATATGGPNTQAAIAAAPSAPATTPASSVPSTPATIPATTAPASPAASRPTTPASAVTKPTSKATEATNSLQQQHAHQQIIQENEQFALSWLKATFEPANGVRIEQEELYKKYLGCCTKIGRRGVIAPLHFPRCVRSVFGGSVGPNPLKNESTGTQYYEGIKVRTSSSATSISSGCSVQTLATAASTVNQIQPINATPVKVLPIQQRTLKTISPVPDSTALENSVTGAQRTPAPASPILKAQLSAPPKPQTSAIPNQPQNPVTKVDSKSQVSVSHPHLSQALLASGSQSRQQQQTQVQVATKDEPRSGATSSSIIKSLLATKVTISGDCMPGVAASCVSTPSACVLNATASIASNISANQLITSNQVTQRQQQQRLLQAQLTGVGQPAAPAATPAVVGYKQPSNAKQKPGIVVGPAKKFHRVNGAKVIVPNNCDKSESNDVDGVHQAITSTTATATAATTTTTILNPTENHVSAGVKVCRPPPLVPLTSGGGKGNQQRTICTPIAEDSDSTNNSLASSSGIGGSRDCSGVGVEEDNSLTSFEGILLNGAPSNLDIDAQDDGSSKDSSSASSKDKLKPLKSMMLADLLERKVEKAPIMNGVLGKNSISEKGMDLVENHIEKVLKESPSEMKIKSEPDDNDDVPRTEVFDETLGEAPRGVKRRASDSSEVDAKKPKYSNGTTSPDPGVDSTTVESTLSSLKSEEQDDDKDSEKATVSSTAANLYAALAADCIEDEIDIDDHMALVKDEPVVKEEPQTFINPMDRQQHQQQQKLQVQTQSQQHNPHLHSTSQNHHHLQQHVSTQIQQQQSQQQQQQQQQHHTPHHHHHHHHHHQQPQQQQQQQPPLPQQHHHQQQQQLIVAAPRQIVVQQTLQPNNQVIIPTTPVKGRQTQQPQVLLQQSAGGQLQYVVSGGVPGQNYVLAQSQTALVQGQPQTVLVAQTTQQQGTGAKTIIILQPQTSAPPSSQKMVAVTPQGQQVVVTQVPRPILQSPALSNIPPPLVPTSATIPQASIIVNSSVAQANSNAVTVTIPALAQQGSVTTSVPSRVVTPTPASTPPPTRPTTPHQAAATHGIVGKQPPSKVTKTNSATSTETDSKPSTSNQAEAKTITIKIDPNAYLCEWRGCLRQFKTSHEVYLHVCEAHCPIGGEEIICLWASCDGLKRRKFSLMTHLYDRHCNAESMALRRKQLTVTGKTEISTATTPAPHHLGYAPNAALHAIKRHALEFVNPKELMQRPSKPAAATSSTSSPRPGQNSPPEQDDNEGPVTKSIRLTAALILRNLVIYSAHGRRHLRAYEPHLAGVALSNVESSRTIAQVLYDMNDQSSSSHR